MGYNSYTTDKLYDNIITLSHSPDANTAFTQDKILMLADRELKTPIMKQILSTRGGYYKTYDDYVAIATGLYPIPSGAIAGAIENVELIQDPTIVPVNPIDESEQYSTISPTSTSYGYFFRGNYVQILPIPNVGNPRIWYAKRTGALVATSACAQITNVAANVLTVASVPSNIVNGAAIDIAGDQPPFNIIGQANITSIVSTTITLDATITGISNGDWVALRDQTCVPQIPIEFRCLLEQRVVVMLYELQGYLSKKKSAEDKLKELEASTLNLITPRVKDKTKIINPVNGGFLSSRNALTNFPAGRIP